MSTETPSSALFNAGAVVFSFSAGVFFLLFLFLRDALRRHVAMSATVVSCVTAAANFAQAEGYTLVTRPDGAQVFWVEWAGYSVSLFFIGSSIFRFLSAGMPGKAFVDALYSGLLLTVVGLGGLFGLVVDSDTRGTQIALVLFTSLVYAVWIVDAARNINKTLRRRTGVLVFFVLATGLYVVGYTAGPPVFGAITLAGEKGMYFAGNILTKIALPGLEIWFMYMSKPAAAGRGRMKSKM